MSHNTLTIEADEGYSVELVTRRRVLIESPDGERYQIDAKRHWLQYEQILAVAEFDGN